MRKIINESKIKRQSNKIQTQNKKREETNNLISKIKNKSKINKLIRNIKEKNKKIVIITGTPGTGKTYLASLIISKFFDFFITKLAKYINITEFVKMKKIYDFFDKNYNSYIIDESKLVFFLLKYINKTKSKFYLIDGHLSHYLPHEVVNFCIVTETDISELKKRLKKRNYSEKKIRENLDAEIFKICENEANESKHKTFIVDTTNFYSKKYIQSLNKINDKIKSLIKQIKDK